MAQLCLCLERANQSSSKMLTLGWRTNGSPLYCYNFLYLSNYIIIKSHQKIFPPVERFSYMKSHLGVGFPTYKLRIVQHINAELFWMEWGWQIQRSAHSDPLPPSIATPEGQNQRGPAAHCPSLATTLHVSIGCASAETSGLIPIQILFLITSALQLLLAHILQT